MTTAVTNVLVMLAMPNSVSGVTGRSGLRAALPDTPVHTSPDAKRMATEMPGTGMAARSASTVAWRAAESSGLMVAGTRPLGIGVGAGVGVGPGVALGVGVGEKGDVGVGAAVVSVGDGVGLAPMIAGDDPEGEAPALARGAVGEALLGGMGVEAQPASRNTAASAKAERRRRGSSA